MPEINYGSIATQIGLTKLSNAALLNTPINITQIKLGDSNGTEYTPDGSETDLKNVVFTGVPNSIIPDPLNPDGQASLELVVPSDAPSFHVREMGLYDADGDLIYIAAIAPRFKPVTSAQSVDMSFEIMVTVLNADNIVVKVDTTKAVATQYYVQNKIELMKLDSQFLPYSATRTYKTGEVCTIELSGEVIPMQMYAGPNLTCVGKDPKDLANRHEAWGDPDSPFWWIPYTGSEVGTPFWWLDTTPPESAVMEINADLPIVVYWRLARKYPHLVTGETINTGEIRGEFLRVLDQGRGVDVGRVLASAQAASRHASSSRRNAGGFRGAAWGDGLGEVGLQENRVENALGGNSGGLIIEDFLGANIIEWDAVSRNVARAMAITI